MSLISSVDKEKLNNKEKDFLDTVFRKYKGFPSLSEIWKLMDDIWIEYGCDQNIIDDKVFRFYKHPVWLLNGLFIQQDLESQENIKKISKFIIKNNPKKILDYGGGFGNLARYLGKNLPLSKIDIFDPHPSNLALFYASKLKNVNYVENLTEKYDFIIATDVFEHLDNPIESLKITLNNLETNGKYLIANCFEPVILCHLPKLFYLNFSWDLIMKELGFDTICNVAHGKVFKKVRISDCKKVEMISNFSRKIYPIINLVPRGAIKIGKLITLIYYILKIK